MSDEPLVNEERTEHDEGASDPEEYEQYAKAMNEMNRRHAVVGIGSDCVVMNEFWDPRRKRFDVNFSTFGSHRNRYLNWRVINPWRGNGKKTRDAGSMWLESKLRREYEQVVFDPSDRLNDRYFNLFKGFAVQPDEHGDWSILRDHVRDVICCGNKDVFNYVMGWMARLFQDPGGERPGTALVFRGAQGSGKGTLANILGHIVGTHYRHILQPVHLTGRFNTHLKDALLVFCDEVTWGGDRAAEGILKGLVTEPTITIEAKGKDLLEIESHVNLIIASNNDWVIPAGLEERRFCVLDVSPEHVGDRAYFDGLYHQMKTENGYARMLYDLLRYNIGEIDLRTIPRTRGLFDQILASMGTVHKWWFSRLDAGRILPNDAGWSSYAEGDILYGVFLDFATTIGHGQYRPISAQFVRKLKELCPGMTRTRPRLDGKQVVGYSFPDLESCRRQFEDAINMPVEWE